MTPITRIRRILESDLPEPLKHTLHVLQIYCDTRDRCYPSYQTIADGLSVSRSTAKRRLKALEALGIVGIAPSRAHQSNIIILCLDRVTALTRGRVTALTPEDSIKVPARQPRQQQRLNNLSALAPHGKRCHCGATSINPRGGPCRDHAGKLAQRSILPNG